jgi:LPXTG-motif cell wall-anchored protein
MGRHTRRLFTTIAIATLAACFVPTAVAGAVDYPIPIPIPGTLTTLGTVQVGGVITVSGTGCGAFQPVTISFNGRPVTTTTTNAFGNFAASFPVPAGTTPGVYTVNASNSVCVLGAVVQVDPASASRLAFTGSSSTIPTLWVGVGLLALGGALVFVARRRLSGAH